MFDFGSEQLQEKGLVPRSDVTISRTFGKEDQRKPSERVIRESMRGTFAACIRARAQIFAQVVTPDVEGPGFTVERLSGGTYEPVEESHPWQMLIRNPNGNGDSVGRTAYHVYYWWLQSMDLSGSAHAILDGLPTEPRMTEVYSEWGDMRPAAAPDGGVSHYVFRSQDGPYFHVEPDRVLASRHPDPVSPFEGQSLIEQLVDYISADRAAMRLQSDAFRDGRPPQMQLLDEGENASPEDRRALLSDLKKSMAQGDSVYPVPAQMKLESLGLDPETWQMLETQGLTHQVIYRVTGIKQAYFDSEGANRSNSESAERQIRRDTIQPLVNQVAQELTMGLTRAFGADVGALRVKPPQALQPTPKEREEISRKRLERGVPASVLMEEAGEEVPEAFQASLSAPRVPGQLETLQVVQAAPEDDSMPADAANKEVALNGAQVTAAKEIVSDVAAGRLDRESGRNMLMIFFGLSRQQADRILSNVDAMPTPSGDEAPSEEGSPPSGDSAPPDPARLAGFL